MSNDVTGGAKAGDEPPERKQSLAEAVAASIPPVPPLPPVSEDDASVESSGREAGSAGATPSTRRGSHARSANGKGDGPGRRERGAGEVAGATIRRIREVVATAIITVAVLAAAALALGAALLALHANQDNVIVATVIDLGHRLDGPFADIFTFDDDAVKQTLVNWGIAAVVYLVAGRIVERVLRP